MAIEEQGCSWPEQDAVEKWWEAHSFELKQAVTQPRLQQQKRADQAERRAAPDALVEALRKACQAALDDADCGRESSFETRDLLEAALRPEREGGQG